MTQRTISVFVDEIYSKAPKQIYITNETDKYYFDDIWSSGIRDIKDYGPENNRGYRYVSVVINNFNEYGWTIPLTNKNSQTMKDSFENFLIGFKRSPNLIETDRGK